MTHRQRRAERDQTDRAFVYRRPPAHIAIIMDGNGRWAKERGLPRIKGHEQGAESVRAVTEACVELGVEFLTVYAFSTENWKRPEAEVARSGRCSSISSRRKRRR